MKLSFQELINYFLSIDSKKQKRRETRFYECILETSLEGIIVIDKNGQILYHNLAGHKILGFNREDIEESNFLQVIHPNDQHQFLDKLRSIINIPNASFMLDLRAKNKQGDYIYIETEVINLLNKKEIKGVVIMYRDITFRKSIEKKIVESELKYRQVFEFSPLPMWIYNTVTLKFIEVNDAAVKEYGYSKKEFLTMTLDDIRPPDDVNIFRDVLGTIKKEKEFSRGVYRHRKKNGEIIYVDVQGNEIEKNDPTRRLVVVRNISERIKHIQMIEEQNKKLNEISWIQSHIVRAPLARLMGLVINFRDENEQNRLKYLDYILKSADELDVIIKEISEKAKQVREEIEEDKDNQL